MKKLLIIPMLLIATVFTSIFINNSVHAVEIDTELQFNKTLYQLYMHDPNTQMDYFDIYLQVGNDNLNTYHRNLQEISLGLISGTVNYDSYIFTLNPNYLIELYRGTGNDRVQYDTIGYVSMIYVTYDAVDYEFAFYDDNHEYITTIRPTDLPYNDIFMHTSYINPNAELQNAFDSGRQQGYNEGKRVGDREGYERGFERARDLFAYYDEVYDDYIPATNWGATEYNRGLNDGLQSTEGQAYEQGYIDGGKDSFMASIKDWIVPSIIIVLFLGGAVTIILRKREG